METITLINDLPQWVASVNKLIPAACINTLDGREGSSKFLNSPGVEWSKKLINQWSCGHSGKSIRDVATIQKTMHL